MGIDTADPVGSLDRWASREQHRLSVLQARKAQALEVLGNAEASREKLKQDQQQWSTRYSKDLHASMLRSGSKFGTTAGSDGMSNVISAKKEIDDADTDILRAKVEEKEYRLKKKLEETEKEREAWREQHVGHRKALQSKAVSILDQAKQKREHRSTELREKWNRERAFLAQSEAEAQADLLAKKREHLSHERAHLGAWKDTLKQKEKQRERLFEEKEKRSKERLELLKNQKKNSEKQKWNQYNALLMKRHGMFMERMEEFHGFQRNLVEQHKSKDEWVGAMRENESLMQQDRSNQLSHYYEYMRGNLGRANQQQERRRQFFANKIERDDKLVDTIQKRKKALENRVVHLNHASFLTRQQLKRDYEQTWMNKDGRLRDQALPAIKLDQPPPIPDLPLPALDIPVPPSMPAPTTDRPTRPMVRVPFNALPNLGGSMPITMTPRPPEGSRQGNRPGTAPVSGSSGTARPGLN